MRKKPIKRNIPNLQFFAKKHSNILAEINKFRREMGMPEILMKKKKCLRCDTIFDSYNEFLCNYCQIRAAKDNHLFTIDSKV
jgi:hypothetical protein